MSWLLWTFWILVLLSLVALAATIRSEERASEVGDTLDKDTGHIPCEDCHDV
jgi:hypothetical protein